MTERELRRQLRKIIREVLLNEEQPLQKLARGVKERGTKGDFSKWCGEAGVTQACIDRATERDAEGKLKKPRRAKQANLAVTFSKAKGGGKTLVYPKREK